MNIERKRRQKPPEIVAPANVGAFVGEDGGELRLVLRIKGEGEDDFRLDKSADHGRFEHFREQDVFDVGDALKL